MKLDEIQHIHDASLPNIEFLECELDMLRLDDKFKMIGLACSKIAHNGTIKIVGIDSVELSRGMFKGYLNTLEFNRLLRPSLCSSDDIETSLNSMGFTVQVSRVNNYRYYIEATRP